MLLEQFLRTVRKFADDDGDYAFSKGQLVVQVRGELIEANVSEKEGQVQVIDETESAQSAFVWIRDRLARLELLANKISSAVVREPNFVIPSASFLKTYDDDPAGGDYAVENGVSELQNFLSNRPAGTTNLIYLTSDAGEGKTTLIDELAARRAKSFMEGQRDWLVVPIRLGGRPFMSLDEIIAAELSNRWRYMVYLSAFIELIKLGAVVPALDGFEEVLVESSSRDGISALGDMVAQLEGKGSLVVAARKSYFELNSLHMQSRFFAALPPDTEVQIARLQLERWSKEKFAEYLRKRGVPSVDSLYDKLASRFGDSHPLLSRAVLVSRLADLALEKTEDELIESLGRDPKDYFSEFVLQIVEREATQKWIDDSKKEDIAKQLLSPDEHLELLTQVAYEMWLQHSVALKGDHLSTVVDLFLEGRHKSADVSKQIREKIKDHALLSLSINGNSVQFDHEDFREYFLGRALAGILGDPSEKEIRLFLRSDGLPLAAIDSAVKDIVKKKKNIENVFKMLSRVGEESSSTSYIKENAARVLIFLSEHLEEKVHLAELRFGPEGLSGAKLSGIVFSDCYFRATDLKESEAQDIEFKQCSFERLRVNSKDALKGVFFRDCQVYSIEIDGEVVEFEPRKIASTLTAIDAVWDTGLSQEPESVDVPKSVELALHCFRIFLRATHVNENVFKQKFGQRFPEFFEDVLPALRSESLIEDVQYKGSGQQNRYKLNVPMSKIEKALSRHFISIEDLAKFLRS